MKITIIGCGWLGLPLAKELMSKGHTVSGTTKSEFKVQELEAIGIDAYVYGLEENSPLPNHIRNHSEVLIITIPPVNRGITDFYGTVLKNLVKQFAKLERVIFTSSIGIYPQQSSIYAEDFEFLEMEKNSTLYHAEHALSTLLGNKLTILRLGGLFGAGRHPVHSLSGKGKVENPFGLVNLVHQSDVIRCIEKCLTSETSGIYNVVYPEHPYREHYYTKLYRQHNLNAINFIISPTIERNIDTSKIKKELGFEFTHSIYDLSDCL